MERITFNNPTIEHICSVNGDYGKVTQIYRVRCGKKEYFWKHTGRPVHGYQKTVQVKELTAKLNNGLLTYGKVVY